MPTIDKAKAKAMWRACLASAFRTALACTIIGCVSLYGPPSLQRLIAFPAFSYVTVILIIINDAALGDALRACWLALYASVHTIGPAVLSLWLIGPNRFSKGTTALAVALAAFVVTLTLPNAASYLVAKRIALGQIVVVYVVAYINGPRTEPIMHPLRVAASTAVGVLACVLALLIPYPRLACREVEQNYKLLSENTLERLKLLVKAVCESDKTSALASISHAKSLAASRTKLLHGIKRYQEGMQWERPPIKFIRPQNYLILSGDTLGEVDTTLRGMELALESTNSFPINNNIILSQDLKHGLNKFEDHTSLTIKQALHNGASPLTVPEPSVKSTTKFLQSLHTIPPTLQDLPIYFFLFCTKLLHTTSLAQAQAPTYPRAGPSKGKWTNWAENLKSPKVTHALKFSLSLGLAELLGLIYSKDNGFWSGLPVAITYVSGREATLRVANLKAQGTVLGTVYGVLGCFVFERFLPVRFLSLLPWFVFTSFLQRSRMYGPAGGISAVIGAILILGRKNFGPPSEFAIARIIETFIGLSCSILVDLIFVPKRASTCAKNGLCETLATLRECLGSLSLVVKSDLLEEKVKKLKVQVNEMKLFIAEAEQEPNFWFLPFHCACYNKLSESFSKMVDLCHFGAHALKSIEKKGLQINGLENEIGHLMEIVCSSIKSFEEICRMKSLKCLEKELEKKKKMKKNNISCDDLELGKSRKSNNDWVVSYLGGHEDDELEKAIGSYLEESRSVVDNAYSVEGEREVKSQGVLSLSAMAFCLSAIMREIIKIEEAIKELIQWENPSCEINLYEISCKLQALHNEN
ncbi:fusaric acid resistance-like protein [Senna tora]|uniref:Fusaric acid resistance-like protein n=1 Tax=Senna tora TaxID=362788 RepID=A0A834TMA2_9FABA|nr:fusaric acid resistance-like protein [Senna tora]